MNDTDEATKLYTEHVDILKSKITSIKKVIDLAITPVFKSDRSKDLEPINYEEEEEKKQPEVIQTQSFIQQQPP